MGDSLLNRSSGDFSPKPPKMVQTWASTQSEDAMFHGHSPSPAVPEAKAIVIPRGGIDVDIAILHPGRYALTVSTPKRWHLPLPPRIVKVVVAVSKMREFEATTSGSSFTVVNRDEMNNVYVTGDAEVATEFRLYFAKRQGQFEFSLGSSDVPARLSVHLTASLSLFEQTAKVQLLTSELVQGAVSNWIGLSAGLTQAESTEEEVVPTSSAPSLPESVHFNLFSKMGFSSRHLREFMEALGERAHLLRFAEKQKETESNPGRKS